MEQGFASQLIPIGLVLKAIGYQGALMIDTYPGFESTWNQLKKCLIQVEGVWAPFFVISKENREEGLLILFEDLKDNKIAKSLIQQEIFILKKDVIVEETSSDVAEEINEWIGFTIHDAHSEFSGIIERIEEMPSQLLAYVVFNGKTVVIPMADELIVDMDPDRKTITMDLPAGLLDL